MSESCAIIEFGPFRLDPSRRLLTRGDEPVALSSRAFDILVLLTAERGRVVTKDEIMSQVWRGMVVEENNLAVQISALRRALADGIGPAPVILTIPGHGYRFVAPITAAGPLPPLPPPPLAVPPAKPATLAPEIATAVPVVRPPRLPWRLIAAVAACAVAGLIAALMLWPRAAPSPAPVAAPVVAPPRLSIAVLPFRDLSDDRCCDYLADAISDDLTTDLSHIPGSVVIARESSDAYRGHAMPTADIGRALNVRYLLEGSLRAVEGQFSINAQLIEAATGGHLWAERFMVPRDHLADAQQQVVQRLASALGVTLVDIEGARASTEHAQNPDAMDLYLRARSTLDRSDTLASITQAQALLEQAVAKQPDDVKSLSELGWLLPRKMNNFDDPTQAADLAEARQIVPRVLALAPDNPLALAAQGALLAFDGKCRDAKASYQAALRIDPHSVPALTGITLCEGHLGHVDQVVSHLSELLRIDPEGPRSRVRAYQMGFAQLMLGHPSQAAEFLQRSIGGDPVPQPGAEPLGRAEWARLGLIAALRQSGDVAGSDLVYADYVRAWPYRSVWGLSALATRAETELPGFQNFMHALRDAGMTMFNDEHADWGVQPASAPADHSLFDPTPLTVPGAATVDTVGLRTLLDGTPSGSLVDFGAGAAVPPRALLMRPERLSAADIATLRQAAHGGTLVVMGSFAPDWSAYNAALQLVQAGVPHVAWYRGGEEAWAQAGLPHEDRREH